MDLPPPPPAGALPPTGDAAPTQRPTRRGRWIAGATIVVLASIVLVVVATSGGPRWPPTIRGYQRLTTAEAKSFEDTMASIKIGDMKISGAEYGTSDGSARIIVERFEGDIAALSTGSVDSFLRSAAGGFAGGTGGAGSVDTSSAHTASRDGVDYECAPVHVQPSDSSLVSVPTEGTMCAWRGASVGLLISFDTSDPTAALDEVEATYGALQSLD